MAGKSNKLRRQSARRKPKQDLLTILLQLLSASYPNDKLSPGVVTAFIPAGKAKAGRLEPVGDNTLPRFDAYYASIVRYPDGAGKQVVMVAYGATIKQAHTKLASAFHARNSLFLQLGEALHG